MTDESRDQESAPPLLADVVTAAELHQEVFPELVQFIHGVITEGFGIVAGPPKLGKSWWTLNIALAVAAGGRAFGKVPVEERDVLLLALEDSPRRLQARIRAVWGDGTPPYRLHILTKVGPGLLIPTITEWLIHHPHGLVVLDTLGRARQQRRRGDDAYLADYQAGVALKTVVDAFPGSALLGVHHTRKASSDDFVDDLSGTLGLAGAADYVLVLRRQRNSTEATLQVTGRDAPEGEYAFTVSGGTWTLAGNELADAAAEAQKRSDSKRFGKRAMEVVAVVNRRAPENHTSAADVAAALGIDGDTARVYLNRLAKGDRILKVATGAYTSVTGVTSVTQGLTCANAAHNSNGDEIASGVTPTVTAHGPVAISGNTETVTVVTPDAPTEHTHGMTERSDDQPVSQSLGATGATDDDLHEHLGATGPNPQSRQPFETGATGVPPGGVTPDTPGQTDRVKLALANAKGTTRPEASCDVCGAQLVRAESVSTGRCSECQLAAGGAA